MTTEVNNIDYCFISCKWVIYIRHPSILYSKWMLEARKWCKEVTVVKQYGQPKFIDAYGEQRQATVAQTAEISPCWCQNTQAHGRFGLVLISCFHI